MITDAQEHCREICNRSRSNFLHATRFLSREQREALQAFYAFCSSVDEAVDATPDKNQARKNIATWRLELDRMYVSTPLHPVGQALAEHLKRFRVPKEYLEEIINGCAMDIDQAEYATFSELDLYCYRVASCVGLVCIIFFRIDQTEENKETAIAMGKALQMTNIIRDIMHDHELGRTYIPKDDLKRFNLRATQLIQQESPDDIHKLLKLEIERARGFFLKAFAGIPSGRRERKKWLPALLMGRVYEEILQRIERNPTTIFRKKMRISKWKKLVITARTLGELYGF